MNTFGSDLETRMIERAKSGDQVALSTLLDSYRPILMSMALRKLHNTDDANDVVQETVVKAVRNLKDFDTSRALRPWLSRICMNCIVDVARQRKAQVEPLDKHEYSLSDNGSAADSADGSLIRGQIMEAFRRLPWRYRQIVMMRHFDHMDVAEIAVKLDRPEGTIKSWLFRARTLLQADLEPVLA